MATGTLTSNLSWHLCPRMYIGSPQPPFRDFINIPFYHHFCIVTMGSIMSTIASIKYILLSSSFSPPAYIAIVLMLASILAAAKAVWKAVLSKRSTVAPQLSDQCYIARLPEDVLLRIFNIATQFDVAVYNSKSAPPPVRLAATCRYWRTVMLSYGTPWSVIYLTKASFTRYFSKYSREALLDVYWGSCTPPDRVDAFVSEHLHRICFLCGHVKPDPERRTPNWLFHGDGRSLQKIRLLGGHDGPRITDLRLFEDGVPQRVHTLTLWDVCPKLTGSGFGGLTTLELQSLHLGDSVDEVKALLAILKASPSLETLHLSTERDWIPPQSLDSPLPSGERIPLLYLTSVSLCGPLPFPNMFLKLLQVPDTAECHVLVSLQSSNSLDALDLLGPEYVSARSFTRLDELTIDSFHGARAQNCDKIFISGAQFSYTRRPVVPSGMRSLVITPQTEANTRYLAAILKKYPTTGVMCLRVGWGAWPNSRIKNVDIMPILPRLPALTSLEYTVHYPEHIQRHASWAFESVPTSDILLSGSSTPSSLGDLALPVIRDIVFRVLQEPPWPPKPLDEVVWCTEILEPLAVFLRQFPALERLTLVSYSPDDSPAAQVWAKSALTCFGLDVRVSVRVEHLEDPYHARRVKAV